MPKDHDRGFKIHRLVEMDIQGERSLKEISEELGMSNPTIFKMRETDEYLALKQKAEKASEKAVMGRLKESTIQIKDKLATYAGECVDILWEIASNKAERATARVSAACELIDRDGRFAKVSRLMNVQPGDDGRPLLPEDVAKDILMALEKVQVKGSVQ